ncbi:hypothetical protein HDU88_005310 [Geranomyces variabilis]|nr:hypothetical protein HDU88_005310 [Geranomyces variabilis]
MIDEHAGQLYSGVSKELWLTIHLIALIVIFFSVCGSFYIIFSTCRAWRLRPLNTTAKLPMWISLTDCLFAFFHGSDHIVSLARGTLTTGPACRVLGFGTVYAMNLPAFWVTTIAFYLFSIIVRSKYLSVGKGDWKMHLFCWGTPFVWGVIPLITDDYGQEPLWCGLPHRLFIFNGAVVLSAMVLSGYFYGHLTYFLWRHRQMLVSMRKDNHAGQRKFLSTGSSSAATPSGAGHYTIAEVNSHEQLGPRNVALSTEGAPPMPQMTSVPQPAVAQAARNGGGGGGATRPSTAQSAAPMSSAQASEKKLGQLVRHLPVFVVIYLLQWFPYLLYALLLLGGKEYVPLNIIVVTLTNAGGVANALAYRRFMVNDNKKEAAGSGEGSSNNMKASRTADVDA